VAIVDWPAAIFDLKSTTVKTPTTSSRYGSRSRGGACFHVEFYDPLVTSKPERSYTYVWPATCAADRLSVIVQEPAAASNSRYSRSLTLRPPAGTGCFSRSAELAP